MTEKVGRVAVVVMAISPPGAIIAVVWCVIGFGFAFSLEELKRAITQTHSQQ